jgi:hypothetical protein
LAGGGSSAGCCSARTGAVVASVSAAAMMSRFGCFPIFSRPDDAVTGARRSIIRAWNLLWSI